jgi:hypothetical protein
MHQASSPGRTVYVSLGAVAAGYEVPPAEGTGLGIALDQSLVEPHRVWLRQTIERTHRRDQRFREQRATGLAALIWLRRAIVCRTPITLTVQAIAVHRVQFGGVSSTPWPSRLSPSRRVWCSVPDVPQVSRCATDDGRLHKGPGLLA